MGAVDHSDQLQGRTESEVYKYIYHFLLNVTITNSYPLQALPSQPEVQVDQGVSSTAGQRAHWGLL